MNAVGVAWFFALSAEGSRTFGHMLSANSSPAGQPSYSSGFWFHDEFRRGFRRLAVEPLKRPITPVVAERLRAELAATDHSPSDMGPFAQRACWYAWLPFPRDNDPPMVLLSARASGWPCLCMSSRRTQKADASQPEVHGALPVLAASSYTTFSTDPDRGALPLIPIWPGFLANTALYAIPWTLLLGFGPARRSLRRRRGLCPACAYDLRATPPGAPCPECGPIAAAR
jgi:hypothetical protein